MRRRCDDPNNEHYGGRKDTDGNPDPVTYPERWKNFDLFYSDMRKRPDETSIDRTDPYGHYTEDGCIWATPAQQALNKRNSRFLSFRGQRVNMSNVAKAIGKTSSWVSTRLDTAARRGIPEEQAVINLTKEALQIQVAEFNPNVFVPVEHDGITI